MRFPLFCLTTLLLLAPHGHRPKASRTPQAAALTLAPQVAAGSSLAVAWSGLDSPTARDWVGIFAPGTTSAAFLDWVYTTGQASGSVTLKIAAGRPAGLYEIRLYRNDGYTLAATGGMIQVGAPPPLPPPPPPPPPTPAAYGPRDPVGPDAPNSEPPRPAVVVSGFTAAAIAAACRTAAAMGPKAVFLPAGAYRMESMVTIPLGVTVMGAGSATICQATSGDTEEFYCGGDGVRLTRMTLLGFHPGWTTAAVNGSRGFEDWGFKGVRLDHCDLSGFSYASYFSQEGEGQVDHCRIHECLVVGLGYGVSVSEGAHVVVNDNEISDCRHCIASNGDVNHHGYRLPHFEAVHNHVFCALPPSVHEGDYQAAMDSHSQYAGDWLIEGNRFESLKNTAIGLISGSGTIRNNLFANLPGEVAIRLYQAQENLVNGFLHDVAIQGNVFVPPVLMAYDLTAGSAITLEGKPVTVPYRAKPGAKR